MTRKHFQQLADNLRSVKPFWPTIASEITPTMIGKRDQWADCIKVVADVCRANCTGFKRERFYEACDFYEDEIAPQAPRGRFDKPAYDE